MGSEQTGGIQPGMTKQVTVVEWRPAPHKRFLARSEAAVQAGNFAQTTCVESSGGMGQTAISERTGHQRSGNIEHFGGMEVGVVDEQAGGMIDFEKVGGVEQSDVYGQESGVEQPGACGRTVDCEQVGGVQPAVQASNFEQTACVESSGGMGQTAISEQPGYQQAGNIEQFGGMNAAVAWEQESGMVGIQQAGGVEHSGAFGQVLGIVQTGASGQTAGYAHVYGQALGVEQTGA